MNNLLEVLGEAAVYVERFIQDARNDNVQWKEQPVQKPGAMRAFEGQTKRYTAIVTQASIAEENRVMCNGMLVAKETMLVVVLPPPVADLLYHIAAAKRN